MPSHISIMVVTNFKSAMQVAMMFMSKAELFHEPSWALWFQYAAGLLPVSVLRAHPGQRTPTISPFSTAYLHCKFIRKVFPMNPVLQSRNAPTSQCVYQMEMGDVKRLKQGACMPRLT